MHFLLSPDWFFIMFNLKNKERTIFVLVVLSVGLPNIHGENHTKFKQNGTSEKFQSSEFPEDLFSEAQRKCGAIILHIMFAVHCFAAIALVCSERFLPTINCICEDLKLSDDVAAATFMSIATSAPELFSNIIGTFITESDIGIGHVIGNGYYNMFFIAALGGLVAKQTIVLDWWPLSRDCFIYALVTLGLTGIVWDGVVQIHETIILLLLYFGYFFVMFNNKKIRNFISYKSKIEIANISQIQDVIQLSETRANTDKNINEKNGLEELEQLESECDTRTLSLLPPLSAPEAENNRWRTIKKAFTMPVNFLIRYTIPDIRINKFRKYYPVAFMICVIWIGVSTYFGTWMISVIGETIGLSDLVMGMVFMAAGGSVVEAYSIYYKVKKGECSIGLSNSIGCNSLDVTLCLALPWFIKILQIQSSKEDNNLISVVLESSLIHLNCLLLLISVITLFIIFYINNFKLDKKLGVVCGGMYVFILFIGISIEGYNKIE